MRASRCGTLGLAATLLTTGTVSPPTHASAQAPNGTGIVVDGRFDDWFAIPLAYEDEPSSRNHGVDFGALWITNDDRFLLLRLEVGEELNLQDDNRVTLYLDADDDERTGVPVRGMGADLVWRFGDRRGLLVAGADSSEIEHQHIGLATAPTVTSRAFEIVLDRRAGTVGGAPLFSGTQIRVGFADDRDGGDVLPNHEGGVEYVVAEGSAPALAIPLAKQNPRHIRVVSYNVNNRLFRARRRDAYRRILEALQPDVLVLQEVREHSSGEVVEYLTPMLPPPRTGTWHHARAGGEGNVVVSPFPIASVRALGESGAFVLDLRPAARLQLLVVSLSAPCCEQNAARQREMDLIMGFIRDAKAATAAVDLVAQSPIVLIGDANLVGYAQQRETLLTGSIVDTAEFGPGFGPDWDGTPFTDLTPRHTDDPMTFTWYGRDFSPGRLDYVVYSDAVLEVGNHFVLYTPEMPDSSLARHGLRADDVRVASNHLPVVVDLAWP